MSLEREFERLHRAIDGLEGQAVKEIAQAYAEGLDNLRDAVRKYYDKYADDDGLTFAEMQKYDRIKKLNKEVAERVKDMHKVSRNITRSELRDTFKRSFDSTKDIIEEAAGRTIQGTYNARQINDAIQAPISGIPLNDRLRRNEGRLVFDVREAIGQGLREGETYTKMSRRLKETTENGANNSMTVARTETHRIQEEAKLQTLDHADKQGVEMKKWWLSSQDERVRTSHAQMGAKYSEDNAIPYKEDFVNGETGGSGPAPGQLGTAKDDINCRCRMIVEVVTND